MSASARRLFWCKALLRQSVNRRDFADVAYATWMLRSQAELLIGAGA